MQIRNVKVQSPPTTKWSCSIIHISFRFQFPNVDFFILKNDLCSVCTKCLIVHISLHIEMQNYMHSQKISKKCHHLSFLHVSISLRTNILIPAYRLHYAQPTCSKQGFQLPRINRHRHCRSLTNVCKRSAIQNTWLQVVDGKSNKYTLITSRKILKIYQRKILQTYAWTLAGTCKNHTNEHKVRFWLPIEFHVLTKPPWDNVTYKPEEYSKHRLPNMT